MTKQDLLFIAFPFLLTAILILIGYQILVSTTPEASITLPETQQTLVEIIEDGNIERITPQAARPSVINGRIVSLPQNQELLDQAIDQTTAAGANTLYLSLAVTLNPDHTLQLTDQDNSSEENLIRWAKTTISAAHQNGLHVILAPTINASQTISDPVVFMQNFTEFLTTWSGLATEYGVTFFSPGVTLGHPLYSQLTDTQRATLLQQTERSIRAKYSGLLGINICCTITPPTNIGSFAYATIIPTPEYNFTDMAPVIDRLTTSDSVQHVLLYDRNNSRVTGTNPAL